MSPRKKTHGKGGTVSCLIKFLHPSQLIRNTFLNPTSGQRLEGCITVHQEVKRINRKDQLSIVIHHDDFKEADEETFQELYAVKKHFTIQAEGDPNFFFDLPVAADVQEEPQELLLPPVVDDELMGENHGGQQNLISALTGVLDIDDNNEPVPENVPGDPVPSVLSTVWGHYGFCYRKSNNLADTKARLVNNVDTTRDDVNLHLFEWLFPRKYIEDVILTETNKVLDKELVTYGELLRWMGLWVLISTVDGSDRRSFWSSKSVNMYEGAPFRLGNYMTRTRFEEILSSLCYTDESPPTLLDRFWEIRRLIVAWNKNMDENFIPSWINAIGESMLKWLNEYTCPRFMFVPRKPWKFGNEYQNAGYGLSDIIWQVDLQEGKDHPAHLGKKEFDELGSTVGTLLCLSKPVHGTGKIFVLDSGLCVLQGLIELKKGMFCPCPHKEKEILAEAYTWR